MFGFSTGRCCCGPCEDCCNGSFAPEFDVAVTLVDGGCTTCDSTFSATYTLAKNFSSCLWIYDTTPTPTNVSCAPPYDANNIWRTRLQLTVNCTDASNYYVRLVMNLWREQFGLPSQWVNDFVWADTVSTGSFSCSGASSFALPFQARFSARLYNGFFWRYNHADDWLCNVTADALLTAVP